MATKTFSPMLGKRIRITELDDCGRVEDGAQFIATSGFITLTLSAEVEDGAEILVKRADGSLCINEKQSDTFKYFNVEIRVCGVNPSLLALTTLAEEYEGYDDDIVGAVFPEGALNTRFALEMWSGLSGADCGEDGESSGYLLLPQVVGGMISDIEFTGEDAVDFTITNAKTKGGNSWGVGPYDVMLKPGENDDPASEEPLPTALDPYDHFLMLFTELAPPASDDQPQTLSLT